MAGRQSWRWQQARRAVLATESRCWLCGGADFVAVPRHARSRSVDHVVPLAKGGSLTDRSNLRLAHLGCNSSRGAKRTPKPPALPARSRRW